MEISICRRCGVPVEAYVHTSVERNGDWEHPDCQCDHYSHPTSLPGGNITCSKCGAVYVIGEQGSGWVDPDPPTGAASCQKGSCQRHGRCMYLNAPWCPLAKSDHEV